MQTDLTNAQYADFGDRFLAVLLDTIIQLPLVAPLLWLLLRADIQAATGDPFLLAERLLETLSSPLARFTIYGIPLVYCALFWKYRSATPGKRMMDMTIVDATTGGPPTTGRLFLRTLGYVVNVMTFFLGFLWIVFDKRKQGLHDKMANTVVIMTPRKKPESAPAR